MNSIKGKFALVTGGTQGLGAAIAKNFADSGAKGIVTIGRKEDKGNEVAKNIFTGSKLEKSLINKPNPYNSDKSMFDLEQDSIIIFPMT